MGGRFSDNCTMATFILTSNPDKWSWTEDEFANLQSSIVETGRAADQWSVGVRRRGIEPGDRCFLLRQHRERGLVASGFFTDEIFEEPHWDPDRPDDVATYAELEWDVLLAAEDRLPVEQLRVEVPLVRWDRLQGSGVRIDDGDALLVERLWNHWIENVPFHSPEDEAGGQRSYEEGHRREVLVNRYERDPRARAACIEHHGHSCSVCDVDFASAYGSLGEGFIHVHHLIDLSAIGRRYRVDPVKDLRPVCPNCHAMLHRTRPAMSIPSLRRRMRRRSP